MSATLLQKRSIRIPTGLTTYSICILHSARWHRTQVEKPYDEVISMAEDAYRRSGLPVQIRDADGTILFEANDDYETECGMDPACRETRSW